jgi:hypothetical protein
VQVGDRTLTDLLYADDTALTSDCETGLQSLLDRLLPYAQAKHLKVNISKSKVVVFGPGGESEPRITYDGKVLPVVQGFRYLGTTLDCKASMVKGATCMRGGMFGAVRGCYKLAAEHGVQEFPAALLRLYCAFVLPHAMYGCQVWVPTTF